MNKHFAIADGNWSNPKIWSNGVLPSRGDIVIIDGHDIEIDMDLVGEYAPSYLVSVDRQTKRAGRCIITGNRQLGDPNCGILFFSDSYFLPVPNYHIGCFNPEISFIIFDGPENSELTIYGTITNGPIESTPLLEPFNRNAPSGIIGIFNKGKGRINFTGNIYKPNSPAIYNKNGIVSITGRVLGGKHDRIPSVYNESGFMLIRGLVEGGYGRQVDGIFHIDGRVTVFGTVKGGSGNCSFGIHSVHGDIFVYGLVLGGAGETADGIYQYYADTTNTMIRVTGHIAGGPGERALGVYSRSGIVRVIGFVENGFGSSSSSVSNIKEVPTLFGSSMSNAADIILCFSPWNYVGPM